MKRILNLSELRDSLLLSGLVWLSALHWVAKLGFYSDDWSYLAPLQQSSSNGLAAMFRSLVHADSGLLVRPVQLACLVLEFRAFGLHALPYHVLVVLWLSLVVVLLYLVLRAVPIARGHSLAIAIVFAFLPQYSTDRFWLSSQQALLCLTFALAGIYAWMRCANSPSTIKSWWLPAESACFILSILAYEVALGLIVASIFITAWQAYSAGRDRPRASSFYRILLSGLPIILLGLIKIHLQHRYTLHHRVPLFWMRFKVWKLAAFHAFQFNIGGYGLRLPAVLISLYRHSAISPASLAVSLAIFILVTLRLGRLRDQSPPLTWQSGLRLMAAGLILFALGYALFSPLPGSAFESAGLNNRITIAAALGASCVLVGLVSLVSGLIPSALRQSVFSILAGLACASYSLVCSGIAFYWADAAAQQALILQNVQTNAEIPRHSTILLDGFCRYSGPAVVFETDWDTTGALQLLFADRTLTADVVSKDMHFSPDAADTFIYGDHEGHYPYGNRVFIFNTQSRLLVNLSSEKVTEEYLHRFNPARENGCPPAQAGDGVSVF